jgi:hypothetical protein
VGLTGRIDDNDEGEDDEEDDKEVNGKRKKASARQSGRRGGVLLGAPARARAPLLGLAPPTGGPLCACTAWLGLASRIDHLLAARAKFWGLAQRGTVPTRTPQVEAHSGAISNDDEVGR